METFEPDEQALESRPVKARPSVSKRATAWIACLAVLLVAFVPGLSAAFGAPSPPSWLEICSTSGAGVADFGPDQPLPAAPGGHMLDHCPYCSIHFDALAPAPVSAPGVPPVRSAEVALGRDDPPRASLAWATPLARAPPAARC